MIKFRKEVPLSQFSNYKIGGNARSFFDAKTVTEIKEALSVQKKEEHLFILGGGTNILFADAGFDGLVLKPSLCEIAVDGNTIYAGAGVLIDTLLRVAEENSLSGLEWAGGLPGTFGGALRGNAGAFGGEIKDSVISIKSLQAKSLEEITRQCNDCKFRYRSSIFREKGNEEIICGATLELTKGDRKKIRESTYEKVKYRNKHHPMEHPNIGSMFKNVPIEMVSSDFIRKIKHVIKIDPFPVIPAAYLISETGLKGVSYGGAMISPKHPNFIVNVLSACSEDVRALLALVRSEVFKKFSVLLEEEVQIV